MSNLIQLRDTELKASIAAIAAKTKRTESSLVREALEEYLKHKTYLRAVAADKANTEFYSLEEWRKMSGLED